MLAFANRAPRLTDALMGASAKESLSELLGVSQRLSLALVIRQFLFEESL